MSTEQFSAQLLVTKIKIKKTNGSLKRYVWGLSVRSAELYLIKAHVKGMDFFSTPPRKTPILGNIL